MPNVASASKRLRQSLKRRARNRPVRTRARHDVRAALDAIEDGAGVGESVRAAASALDRAAQKGVIHPRNAARKKSRLMRRANRATQSA